MNEETKEKKEEKKYFTNHENMFVRLKREPALQNRTTQNATDRRISDIYNEIDKLKATQAAYRDSTNERIAKIEAFIGYYGISKQTIDKWGIK